jgi:hypothetical protein
MRNVTAQGRSALMVKCRRRNLTSAIPHVPTRAEAPHGPGVLWHPGRIGSIVDHGLICNATDLPVSCTPARQ